MLNPSTRETITVTSVRTATLTFTKSDVLYVNNQITKDLRSLSASYPSLISSDRILDLSIAMATFISNDAVGRLGFSIYDPADQNLVYHELRYRIFYGAAVARSGDGGRDFTRVSIPSTAKFKPWVGFTQKFCQAPLSKQRDVVAGTGWGLPGSSTFKGRYTGGVLSPRSEYRSGILGASMEEYSR
jgi:hypothetical protein